MNFYEKTFCYSFTGLLSIALIAIYAIITRQPNPNNTVMNILLSSIALFTTLMLLSAIKFLTLEPKQKPKGKK